MYSPPKRTLRGNPLKRVLDDFKLRFVDEYLIDFDAPAAATRAGAQDPQIGNRLLGQNAVLAAIQIAQAKRNVRVGLQQDYILKRWLAVVEADPRELIEHWRVCCRHCWGIDHRYQFKDTELREAMRHHQTQQLRLRDPADRVEFDDLGGGGYNINRPPMRGADWVEFVQRNAQIQGLMIPNVEPNADHSCPHCSGHGDSFTILHDTRDYSPAAAALYLGVKPTSRGSEVLMRSKPEAEQLLARHMGMIGDRGKDEKPEELTNEQLDAELSRHGIVVDADFTDVTERAEPAGRVGEREAPPVGTEPEPVGDDGPG